MAINGLQNAVDHINWMEPRDSRLLLWRNDVNRLYAIDEYRDDIDFTDPKHSYYFAYANKDYDGRISIRCRDTGELFECGRRIKKSLLKTIIEDRIKHGWGPSAWAEMEARSNG